MSLLKTSVLHPERGAVHRKGIRQWQRRARSSPANPHSLVSPETWDKNIEMKSDVSEGNTEVAELRKNVNVHTFVLPVMQHLGSCSTYTYAQMRWETSNFKVLT